MAGVPSAVMRQREKLEAELGVRVDGTPVEPASTPPDLSVVPTTPVATQPTAEPAADPSQARIKELEHLLSTRDGQTSTAMREANEARQRAEVMASQVRALEESVAALTKQAETAEARASSRQADSAIPSFEVDEPTQEELDKFQPDSVGFITKLSKKQLIAYMKPMYDKLQAMEKQLERVRELDKLPQLEKAVADSGVEAERVREEEFFRKEVLAYFSDFETIRTTPEWKSYLHEDVPGRGMKIFDLLDHYRKVHNAKGIRSLIQGHYDAQKIKPTLASLATPSGTQVEGTPVSKPRLKASDYKQKLKEWTHKRVPTAQWEAFKSDFNAAMNEGRVDMDVQL